MSSTLKFGIDLSGGKVHIVDLSDQTTRIEVDQVLFDATYVKGDKAEGYIVAVHGFPQEIAHILPAQLIRDLGIGTPMTKAFRARSGLERLRAVAGAKKFSPAKQP